MGLTVVGSEVLILRLDIDVQIALRSNDSTLTIGIDLGGVQYITRRHLQITLSQIDIDQLVLYVGMGVGMDGGANVEVETLSQVDIDQLLLAIVVGVDLGMDSAINFEVETLAQIDVDEFVLLGEEGVDVEVGVKVAA